MVCFLNPGIGALDDFWCGMKPYTWVVEPIFLGKKNDIAIFRSNEMRVKKPLRKGKAAARTSAQ